MLHGGRQTLVRSETTMKGVGMTTVTTAPLTVRSILALSMAISPVPAVPFDSWRNHAR
jgi:hypothetical protein